MGMIIPDWGRLAKPATYGLHSNRAAWWVLLKRLDDTLADGDSHTVIKGTAINNDADAKGGFTASSLEGIVRITAEVLAVSGVDPATLGFLEAHRTGTDEVVYRRAIATSRASSRWS